MPDVILGLTETLHVLVPSRSMAAAVQAVSPRIRAHRLATGAVPSREAASSQVWVPGSPDVPPGFFEQLPHLELVQLTSAGAEAYVGRLPASVVLCNARGAHTPSTAEWAVTAMLAAQRGIPLFVRQQDEGRWAGSTQHSMVGAKVLVIGAGDIGRRIARMLAGFDVDLTFVARRARDGVRCTDDLPELLPWADVVVLILPVTEDTAGMVDAEFLAAMADDALLVNAARGVIVDTDALLAELLSGRLRAALDVTDPEPLPAGHPLWRAPNLLLTPHVGGAVPDTAERATRAVTDQLARIIEGRPLQNVVDQY